MTAGTQVRFAPPQPRRAAGTPRKGVRVFIGFDLGLRMGYGVVDEDGKRVQSGVWHFSNTAHVTRMNPGARWLRAHGEVRRFLGGYANHGTYRLASVGYELVRRHEGVQAAHVYGGFEALVLAQCAPLHLKPDTVEVADLKLTAVGVGGGKRADKDAITLAARRRWPECGDDSNEADAMWVADMERRRVLGVAL